MVVAAEVVAVAGNYSIATGGSMAAVDEMMGNSDGAGDRAVQARKEATEVLRNWSGWAKEKVQDGLGLSPNHSAAGPSGVGQSIADKAEKAKEKVYEAGSAAFEKASDKAQRATEAIYETTKEAANKAQVWKGKAAQQEAQEDTEETAHKANEDQEASTEMVEEAKAEEEKAAEMEDEAEEEGGSTMDEDDKDEDEEEEEEEEEGAKAQDTVSWAKQGYTATKRKASYALHNAKRKISITGSHGGEL